MHTIHVTGYFNKVQIFMNGGLFTLAEDLTPK